MNPAAARGVTMAEDESIARRVAARERSAFALLMRRHNPRLYRLAGRMQHSDADAEDAPREALLSAYRSTGQFRRDAALVTWLSRLVLNECLRRVRRHARRQNVIPILAANMDTDVDAMTAHDPDPPFRAAARAEMHASLERKLDQLPTAFHIVFVLRSILEIASRRPRTASTFSKRRCAAGSFGSKSLLRESLASDIDLADHDLFEFGGDD
jgi:RNA polymerase sigma-70 factor (ECF subfamily)